MQKLGQKAIFIPKKVTDGVSNSEMIASSPYNNIVKLY